MHLWIKGIKRYKFDVFTNFDELRKGIKLVEKEHIRKIAQSTIAVTSTDTEKDEIMELKGMIQQLAIKFSAIEQANSHKRFEKKTTNEILRTTNNNPVNYQSIQKCTRQK